MGAGVPLGVAVAAGATAGTATAAGTAAAVATSAALAASSAAAATAAGGTIAATGFAAAGAAGGGLAAGATLGPAAGGGFLAGVFGSLTTLELVQGGLSVAAGTSGIIQGQQAKKQKDFQAKVATLGAQRQALEGQRQAIIALEESNRVSGRAAASIGASGIKVEGSPNVTLDKIAATGALNVNLAQLSGAIGQASGELQAAGLRSQGRAARAGGFLSAINQGSKFASQLQKRRG